MCILFLIGNQKNQGINYLEPPQRKGGSIEEVLAGHASGCWRSELGAGVPYNREKTKV